MILHVRVKAGTKINKIEKDADGNWTIKIMSQPIDGKANEALVKFLSEKLRVPKSSIEIISGHTRQFKRINIEGIALGDLERRLQS